MVTAAPRSNVFPEICKALMIRLVYVPLGGHTLPTSAREPAIAQKKMGNAASAQPCPGVGIARKISVALMGRETVRHQRKAYVLKETGRMTVLNVHVSFSVSLFEC